MMIPGVWVRVWEHVFCFLLLLGWGGGAFWGEGAFGLGALRGGASGMGHLGWSIWEKKWDNYTDFEHLRYFFGYINGAFKHLRALWL